MHRTQNQLDKNEKTEFLQKTRTLDLKIQRKSPLKLVLMLINSRKHECKYYQPKDKMKIPQEGIRKD